MHQPFYRIYSRSKNAVIFIHGFIGTPNHFERFYVKIPDDWSIYNILLDGHGSTVEAFAKTSMNKWKNQVKQVIDDVKKDHESIYIVAHSMGTLLSIEYSILSPSQIKGLFLLAIPLHVHITPLAIANAVGTIFELSDENNQQLQAAKAMYSVEVSRKFWKYIPWIPRYFELLNLCKWTRNMISHLSVSTIAIQSKKDELVSQRSTFYLKNHPHIHSYCLNHSTHYLYPQNDEDFLISLFMDFISQKVY